VSDLGRVPHPAIELGSPGVEPAEVVSAREEFNGP
jgi:hypothetical protein